MLTERSKVPSEQKKRDFFPAKKPVDARREVVGVQYSKLEKTHHHKGCCWLASRRGSKYEKKHPSSQRM